MQQQVYHIVSRQCKLSMARYPSPYRPPGVHFRRLAPRYFMVSPSLIGGIRDNLIILNRISPKFSLHFFWPRPTGRASNLKSAGTLRNPLCSPYRPRLAGSQRPFVAHCVSNGWLHINHLDSLDYSRIANSLYLGTTIYSN